MGPHAGNRSRPAYSGQSRFVFPEEIIDLFRANGPLPFRPPAKRRKLPPVSGLANYTTQFEPAPKPNTPRPTTDTLITPARRKRARAQAMAARRDELQKKWLAQSKEKISSDTAGDPSKPVIDPKTGLFIHGLSLATSEGKLCAELSRYGPVTCVHFLHEKAYAFAQFERERDMRAALHNIPAKRIDGRRLGADTIRGEGLVQGFLPNRIAGKRRVSVTPPIGDAPPGSRPRDPAPFRGPSSGRPGGPPPPQERRFSDRDRDFSGFRDSRERESNRDFDRIRDDRNRPPPGRAAGRGRGAFYNGPSNPSRAPPRRH